MLQLNQEDLERELANMEQLLKVLQQGIKQNRSLSWHQRAVDCKELEETFDVAMTAMKQVWLWLEPDTTVMVE